MALEDMGKTFAAALVSEYKKPGDGAAFPGGGRRNYDLGHGDVVIAAITSCTNTSNPKCLDRRRSLARNAVERGLKVKPWVKTSLRREARSSRSIWRAAGLQKPLDKLGFNLVGFGCTTCIGNSGPLPAPVSKTINDHDLVAASVLSGNRNFEGRVNPDVQANYLASPPLVVAFALAGTVAIDLNSEPLGHDKSGEPVYLRDIWPSNDEIAKFVRRNIYPAMFKEAYGEVFDGDAHWRKVKTPASETYAWDDELTYVRNPPYFSTLTKTPSRLKTSSRRGFSRCSATRSPPITFRRRARSKRRLRPANGCKSRGSRLPISTNMARGAAIMR